MTSLSPRHFNIHCQSHHHKNTTRLDSNRASLNSISASLSRHKARRLAFAEAEQGNSNTGIECRIKSS
ncbi:hypothetical protein NL676_025672 [Syzygium grande]|nr:hypothetical protein NL676_025672 [Syzygium grande]